MKTSKEKKSISLKNILFGVGILIFLHHINTISEVHKSINANVHTKLSDFSSEIQAEIQVQASEIEIGAENNLNAPYRKWAYAFLIGGCNRKNTDYTGFIANAAVAAKRLQDHNSTADVVLLIQMSHDSEYDTLSEDELKFLAAVPNIQIRYIPKVSSGVHQNFYSLMMEKFRILDLTEYSRVLFLDSDNMPKRSLDYLFDIEPEQKPGEPAVPATMMENVIFERKEEPAQGGIFMLKPNHDDYLRAIDIITETEKKALDLDWPHWDPVLGFGEPMLEEWGRSGNQPPHTNWTWHGSFADQGFLYHWVKYVKKQFSIIIFQWHNELVNYSPVNGKAEIVADFKNDDEQGIFNRHSDLVVVNQRHHAPTCDFVHFVGKYKPWQLGRDESKWPKKRGERFWHEFIRMWYSTLDELEGMTNVTLKFTQGTNKSPVGGYPTHMARIEHIRQKAANGWKMYA